MPESFFVSIDMERLDGPATVVSLDGTVTDIGGAASRPLALGDTVDVGAHLVLASGVRLVLRLVDGRDVDYAAPPEAKRSIAFNDPKELDRPAGPELYDAQVAGFTQLLNQARTLGFDPNAMLGRWGSPSHPRATQRPC